MTPKTTRESIISLEGHITGLKRDMHNLKTNDLAAYACRVLRNWVAR